MTDRICVAQIGAPHGVRGEVRLRSFTEDPLAFVEYGPLESEDRKQRFKIEALRPAKDHFVARLSGVADRNAAEKLTNVKLYVPRDVLPDIDEEYESGLVKAGQTLHYEEVLSPVLFVVKMGPDAYKDKTKFPSGPSCKVGDFVLVRPNTGTRIKIHGKEFRIIYDDSVQGVVQDPRGITKA